VRLVPSFANLLFASMALPMLGQPVLVYSELAQLDAKGNPVAPATPREILSPALIRNGITSFQVVVQPSDDAPWKLYIAQNPENAVGITLYRVNGDRLDRVAQPASGSGAQVLWMDVTTARTAPVERIKIEPQLNYHDDWVIYPIEGRVVEGIAPNVPSGGGGTRGSATPADVAKLVVCGVPIPAGPTGAVATIAGMRARNAEQDRAISLLVGRAPLAPRYGPCPFNPPIDNPEWYLRVRDFLFREP
jgi:hypothetical protein